MNERLEVRPLREGPPDETAEALAKLSELMDIHGVDSEEVREFLARHRDLPQFLELAEESRRLEQMFRATPAGRPARVRARVALGATVAALGLGAVLVASPAVSTPLTGPNPASVEAWSRERKRLEETLASTKAEAREYAARMEQVQRRSDEKAARLLAELRDSRAALAQATRRSDEYAARLLAERRRTQAMLTEHSATTKTLNEATRKATQAQQDLLLCWGGLVRASETRDTPALRDFRRKAEKWVASSFKNDSQALVAFAMSHENLNVRRAAVDFMALVGPRATSADKLLFQRGLKLLYEDKSADPVLRGQAGKALTRLRE